MKEERKAFALRLRKDVYDALQRWADDEFRSVNGQIEYLVREALARHGRLPREDAKPGAEPPPGAESD